MFALRIEHMGDSLSDLPSNGWAEFGRELTIGRGKENILTLENPAGSISKRHCTITRVNGECVLVDHSRNGTFLNGNRQAVAKETPIALKSGDFLQIGPYRLSLVVMSEAGSPELSAVQDELPLSERSLLGVVRRPTPRSLDHYNYDALPAFSKPEIGRVGAFAAMELSPEDSLMLPPFNRQSGGFTLVNGEQASVTSMVYIQPRLSTEPIPDDWDLMADLCQAPMSFDENDSLHAAAETTGEQGALDTAALSSPPDYKLRGPDAAAVIAAFFQGCGLDVPDETEEDLCALLYRAGQALKVTISNFQEDFVHADRADLARALERPESNPLKLTAEPGTVLLALLSPPASGPLVAHEAIDQAFSELRQRSIAADVESRKVLRGVLDQLAPETIERNVGADHLIGRHLSVLQHAKYWQAYQASYLDVVADIGAGDRRTRGGKHISHIPSGSQDRDEKISSAAGTLERPANHGMKTNVR